jgi:hypothetical protein
MAMAGDDDLVPIKVRRKDLRMLKAVASWRGLSLADYLTELIAKTVKDDLNRMIAELGQVAEEPTPKGGGKK